MKTKELINEWKKFLNENRIIPLTELINILKTNEQYSEDDASEFTKFWNSNQFSSKYSQVIKNELEKGEPISHIIDAVSQHYHKVYQSTGPKTRNLIGNGTYTIDDLRKELDEKSNSNNFNKKELRQQCQYQNGRPVVGQYQDFNVIHSGEDWVVIEPKTAIGSIAWAHGKPDGSEETAPENRVGWCTGVTSGNNMFKNYANNLYMFYFINSDYDKYKGSGIRRLCLAYIKTHDGQVELHRGEFGDATVDANNKSIDQEYINKYVDGAIIEKITSLVSQRKETSFKEVYSKITVSQLMRQIRQMKIQGTDVSAVGKELSNYAKYADKSVAIYILDFIDNESKYLGDQKTSIERAIIRREDFPDLDPSGDLARKFLKSSNDFVRDEIVFNENISLSEINPEGDLIESLVTSEYVALREALAKRKDLLELENADEIIYRLARDSDDKVKLAVAERKDLHELDDVEDVVRVLGSDPYDKISSKIAAREDLYEIDPSGDLIRYFLNKKSTLIKIGIASNKDLLKIGTHGEDMLRTFFYDEDERVRAAVASNKCLLEFDPSGDMLDELANDRSILVQRAVAARKDLLEFADGESIVSILSYSKDEEIRSSLRNSKEYEKLLPAGQNESTLRRYIKFIIS